MKKGLWIMKGTKIEIKDKTHWAKLRIKKDSNTENDFIDILFGKKGKTWKTHLGINLDQTILFSEYRGVIHSIKRDIDSKIRGHLETNKYIVDPDLKPGKNLILKFDMKENTNEVKIVEFRLA